MVGIGYDIHRLVDNRPLFLGGIKIDYEMGLAGHSDGDVLLHAICDALLGAANLGDIKDIDKGAVRDIVLTGDHDLTCLAVAQECL